MISAAHSLVVYIRRLVAGPNFWRASFAIGAFWLVAAIADFIPLYTFTRVAIMVFQAAILVVYLPGFLHAFASRGRDAGDQLAMGLWVFQLGSLLLGIWALVQRVFGIQWMLTSDLITFWIYIELLGAMLHITAPGSKVDYTPRKNWALVALGFGLGVAATVLIMVFGAELVSKL